MSHSRRIGLVPGVLGVDAVFVLSECAATAPGGGESLGLAA
jgi:hypothetical protein